MKIFCVTGPTASQPGVVAELLAEAGVTPATELSKGTVRSFREWHKQVLRPNSSRLPQVGKAWDQLATNLFLENIKHPTWMWADPRSIWLLDYWYAFDIDLCFILTYAPPSQAIADAIKNGKCDKKDLELALQNWEIETRATLRSFHAHRDRCIWVNTAECLSNPTQFVQWCNQLSGQELSVPAMQPVGKISTPLLEFLVEQLLVDEVGITELQLEAESSLLTLDPTNNSKFLSRDGVFSAIADYRAIQNDALKARALEEEGAEYKRQLRQVDERLFAAEALLKTEQAQCAHEQLRALAEHSNFLAEQARAGRLREEIAELLREIEDLRSQAAESNHIATSLRSEVVALEEQIKSASHVQLLLDEKSKEIEYLSQRIEYLEVAVTTAESAALEASQMLVSADAHALESTKFASAEFDSLVSCLHEVQEALADANSELNSANFYTGQLRERLVSAANDNPDYISKSLLRLEFSNEEDGYSEWICDHLLAGGQLFEKIRIWTVRGPEAAHIDVDDGNGRRTLDHTRPMATKDWRLFRAIVALLKTELSETRYCTLIRLRELVSSLELELLSQPDTLRADGLTLKFCYTSPDYEHLWFAMENFTVGKRHVHSFEFRLACGGLSTHTFGAHPRLEFPESTKAIFDSWFCESINSFGENLELRFALPDAMDISIWQKLSVADRLIIKLLLKYLQQQQIVLTQKNRLSRPLDEWVEVIRAMNDIFDVRTQEHFEGQD